ncbi:unnamed protein product, partial [Brassica napus]
WVWAERNSRLHRHTFRSPDVLLRLVDCQIKDRINSLRKSTQQLVHSSSNYGFLLVILPSPPLDCSILRLVISHQTFPNPFWAKLQWVS